MNIDIDIIDINEKIERVISTADELNCVVAENEPLKKYTTFKIGGECSALIIVHSVRALAELYAKCTSLELPCMVIGNGSNLLVSDGGYKGIVFKLEGELRDISSSDGADYCVIKAGAGLTLARLCKYACEHSLSGLEFAWGIPGTVGGATFMNAGAYGGEMKNVIEAASYVSSDGTLGTVTRNELDFDYRHSIFSEKPGIITSVTMRLEHCDEKIVRARMDDFMNRRRTKQPLEYPSAGSVFKRPEGYFAGGLIEECGLKGKQIGGAQVSEKHAGFIINKDGATCEDVRELIGFIQKTVKEQKGVELECEIKQV